MEVIGHDNICENVSGVFVRVKPEVVNDELHIIFNRQKVQPFITGRGNEEDIVFIVNVPFS
jgi:hypothetical protein